MSNRYGFFPAEILHPWHMWQCADDTLAYLIRDIGRYVEGKIPLRELSVRVDETISYRQRLPRESNIARAKRISGYWE